MPFRRSAYCLIVLSSISACSEPPALRFISTAAPTTAITHVRVIDGSGGPGADDQTLIIQDGRIRIVGRAASVAVPAGAQVIDGHGRTVIPGLVGMHEHLFYENEGGVHPADAAFARLYLASGVTTIRTAGSVDFDADLRLKRHVDSGGLPGPKIHLTGEYLTTQAGPADPERIAREVASQVDRGATSFKAYTSLRSSELKAAIQAAHQRGLRITGHLCAVGFREAADLGIDNLEHGLAVDTEFFSNKQPDVCPNPGASVSELARLDMVTDAAVRHTIADLVRHGVAVTSTLAVFETLTGRPSAFDPRTPGVLAFGPRRAYDAALAGWSDQDSPRARMWSAMLTREMEFEKAFVAAGGRLMAGVDPTGWGGVVAGFGDQRELELLVEAGMTPETAIRVATSNGAYFLYEGDHVGTIAAGFQADLVLLRGNPSARISDVRNVEVVFKDGVGYDPEALIAATQGSVGRYVDDARRIFRWPYNVFITAIVLTLAVRVVMRRLGRRRARVVQEPQPVSS
jgi:imidazolonepropionase-like amidohydrolase